jgi:hypothetical protein
MPHIDSKRRRPAVTAPMGAVLVLLLASLGLAACGGSSNTTATSANASATAPRGATGTGATGPGGTRFEAVRECLQKNGIKLPQRPPGQRGGRPGGPSGPRGFFGGAGGANSPQLPNGVSRAQLQAAIKKCGGGAGGQILRRGTRLKSPAYLAALTKFATCMRENGVNVPAPNTSGNGPIFSTKGLNTASAQFRSAELKCRSDLIGALRRGPGAGATGAAGAAPPGGPAAG